MQGLANMATGLAVMATAAANNDSEGDTNLGTAAAGPIGATCGTSARKERCRERGRSLKWLRAAPACGGVEGCPDF